MSNATSTELPAVGSPVERGVRALVEKRGTVHLTLDDLGVLAATAERNGTTHHFQAVAMEWCGKANAEIERLRGRVLELEAVHEDASGAILEERARHAALCDKAVEDFVPKGATDPFSSGFRSACALLKQALGRGHNVEFSGVPAGRLSNHPAGGTSAATQG